MPVLAVAAETLDRVAVARRDQRAMHDRRAGVADDLEIAAGPRDAAGRRDTKVPCGSSVRSLRKPRLASHSGGLMPCRRSTVSYSIFDWQQCWRTGTARSRPGRGGAAQQLRRAGLDAVGRQHGADQAAGAALEACGRSGSPRPGRAGRAPRRNEQSIAPSASHVGVAGAVGRAEIDAQAELLGGVGRGGELVVGLAPCAVEQRRDRQRGRDAVADQLGEGVALLERQLLRRDTSRPGRVADSPRARPGPSSRPAGCRSRGWSCRGRTARRGRRSPGRSGRCRSRCAARPARDSRSRRR